MRPKNQPALSLPSPLPYLLKDVENGFAFKTDFGITYEISFTDDSGYLLESSFSFVNDVFSFSITHVAGHIQQKDPRVEQTIIKALFLTFEASPNAVLNYVCSLDDSKEVARNKLFHGWYLKLGKEIFVKLDHTSLESRIYSSIIFRRNHPAEEEIKRMFRQVFNK